MWIITFKKIKIGVCNLSLASEICPNLKKKQTLCPFIKKNDNAAVDNYRPIYC